MLSSDPPGPLETPSTRSRRKRDRDGDVDTSNEILSTPSAAGPSKIGSTSRAPRSSQENEIGVTWKQDDQIKALLIGSACDMPLPSPTQKPKPLSSRSAPPGTRPSSITSHPRKRPCRPHRSLPSHPDPTSHSPLTATRDGSNGSIHAASSSTPTLATPTSASSLSLRPEKRAQGTGQVAATIGASGSALKDQDAGRRLDALLGEFAKTYLTPTTKSEQEAGTGGSSRNSKSDGRTQLARHRARLTTTSSSGLREQPHRRPINQSRSNETPTHTHLSTDLKPASASHNPNSSGAPSHLQIPTASPTTRANPSPTKAPRIGLRSTGSMESALLPTDAQSKRGSGTPNSTRAPFKSPLMNPGVRSSPRRHASTGPMSTTAGVLRMPVRAIGLSGGTNSSTPLHSPSPLANRHRLPTKSGQHTLNVSRLHNDDGVKDKVEVGSSAAASVGEGENEEDIDGSGDASFDSFDGFLEGGGPEIEQLLRTIDGARG